MVRPLMLLAVAVGLAGVVGCEKKNQLVTPPPPKVKVASPIKQGVRNFRVFTGTTTAVDSVDIRARVNGYLKSIHFKDGSDVEAGDLLFTIEQEPFQATVKQAEANLRKMEAANKLAGAELARTETLVNKNVANQADLDTRRAERDTAIANIEAAQAELDRAELDLGYTEIRSPIKGRAGRHLVDVGNIVQAEQTMLTTVRSYDPIYVYFTINERDVLDFRARQVAENARPDLVTRVPIRMGLLTEEGYPHKGVVDFADLSVDAATGTYLIRGVFDNPQGLLLPGLFVRIQASDEEATESLLIPERAVGSDQLGQYLLIVNGENEVERRTVSLGIRLGEYRVVEKGLAEGNRIVVDGLQRARPGSKVEPVDLKLEPPVDPNAENAPDQNAPAEAPAAEGPTPAAPNAGVESPGGQSSGGQGAGGQTPVGAAAGTANAGPGGAPADSGAGRPGSTGIAPVAPAGNAPAGGATKRSSGRPRSSLFR